jgi:DNA polymerase/3'-5' exonuclease PolX
MNLQTAQRYADHLLTWLSPVSETVEVAGSVRRSRPVCNDIDIVCIPRIHEERDMFGTVTKRVNLVHEFLKRFIAECRDPQTRWKIGETNPNGKQFIIELRKCQLDLWMASKQNFGTRLLCRTGSMEHNIFLADLALRMGGKWESYDGVRLNGKLFPAETEEQVYNALDLPFIEPKNREIEFLRKSFGKVRG